MPFCPRCGAKVDDETAVFCPECGRPLKEEAITAGARPTRSRTSRQSMLGLLSIFCSALFFIILLIDAFVIPETASDLTFAVIGFSWLALAIAGLTLGIVGIARATGGGRVVAIVGTVLGGICLGLWVFFAVVGVMLFGLG